VRGFYRPELGGPGTAFRWSRALGYLHAPRDARRVELKVRSAAPMPQTLTVEIRGQKIDEIKLTDQEWHTLTYPLPARATDAQGSEWVVLRVDPIFRPKGDGRRLGVMMRGLKWN
jgi:hypothetical protein